MSWPIKLVLKNPILIEHSEPVLTEEDLPFCEGNCYVVLRYAVSGDEKHDAENAIWEPESNVLRLASPRVWRSDRSDNHKEPTIGRGTIRGRQGG